MSAFLGWAITIYAVLSLSSMAVMNIGAALVLVALLHRLISGRMYWARFRDEAKEPSSRWVLLLSCALALTCAISLLAGKFAPLSYAGRFAEIRFFSDFAKSWYLFWPFLLVVALRELTGAERKRALRAWLATFGALAVIGLAQFFTGWPRPQLIPGHEPFYHVTLFLGHHLSVASVLIFPFFAALDGVVARTQVGRLDWPRGVWFGFIVAGLMALLGTYSRMLWAALPLGILLWIVLALRGKARSILVASVIVAGFAAYQWEPVRARVQAGMGIQERVELWEANLAFFKNRPLTGIGWRNTEELSGYYFAEKKPGVTHFFVGHAHNNLLEMLGGTGALGTLAWLAWSLGVLGITWNAFCRGRRDARVNFAQGLFCAWIVFHLNGLTQVNFWEGKVMHQMSWVLAWTLLWASSSETKTESRV